MKKIFMCFTTLILMGITAQAGILIDPYIGYMVSGSDNSGSTLSGSDMGVRLGWSSLGLGVGIDATLAGTYTYKLNGASSDGTPAHTGLFVSYTFPVLVRAYGTYFMNSKVSSGSTAVTGNGTKIGVQFTGLPFVAVGLELYTMNYTELEILGVKTSTSGSENQTRLAVSVPFNL